MTLVYGRESSRVPDSCLLSSIATMVTAVNPFSFILLVLITIGRVGVSASNTNKIKIGADIGRRCFCPATTQFIRPRVAQNKDGQIAFILNNPEFSQRVKIVICKEESQSKRSKKSRCFQEFSEVELQVQLGGNGKQGKSEMLGKQTKSGRKGKKSHSQTFSFPSGCKCMWDLLNWTETVLFGVYILKINCHRETVTVYQSYKKSAYNAQPHNIVNKRGSHIYHLFIWPPNTWDRNSGADPTVSGLFFFSSHSWPKYLQELKK